MALGGTMIYATGFYFIYFSCLTAPRAPDFSFRFCRLLHGLIRGPPLHRALNHHQLLARWRFSPSSIGVEKCASERRCRALPISKFRMSPFCAGLRWLMGAIYTLARSVFSLLLLSLSLSLLFELFLTHDREHCHHRTGSGSGTASRHLPEKPGSAWCVRAGE